MAKAEGLMQLKDMLDESRYPQAGYAQIRDNLFDGVEGHPCQLKVGIHAEKGVVGIHAEKGDADSFRDG